MFYSPTRNHCLALGMAAAAILAVPARAHTFAAPTAKQFMRVLDAQIQRAKPSEVFRRTIIFAEVSAGAPEGNVYPFTATATIHDYSPGFPPNRYYGKTCLTKIVGARYNMLRDRLGEWTVQGKVKSPDPICADNPVEGKSKFPLDSIRGTRVGTSEPLPELMTKKRPNVNLRLGEYACTWPGGRLASQMKFRLNRDKTYTDLDGARGGTYTFDQFSTELRFNGGFLDKMGGKNVEGSNAFAISPTLTCQPWG